MPVCPESARERSRSAAERRTPRIQYANARHPQPSGAPRNQCANASESSLPDCSPGAEWSLTATTSARGPDGFGWSTFTVRPGSPSHDCRLFGEGRLTRVRALTLHDHSRSWFCRMTRSMSWRDPWVRWVSVAPRRGAFGVPSPASTSRRRPIKPAAPNQASFGRRVLLQLRPVSLSRRHETDEVRLSRTPTESPQAGQKEKPGRRGAPVRSESFKFRIDPRL